MADIEIKKLRLATLDLAIKTADRRSITDNDKIIDIATKFWQYVDSEEETVSAETKAMAPESKGGGAKRPPLKKRTGQPADPFDTK